MKHLAADPVVKLLVLRGAGTQAFSPGADIREFPDVFRKCREHTELQRCRTRRADRLGAVGQADTRRDLWSLRRRRMRRRACLRSAVRAEDARFGITPSKLGLAYSPPEMKRLVALVGPSRAKDIIYSGRLLPGPEAKEAGLIDFLAPASELEDVASRYAMELLANSQHSIRAAKAIINSVADIHVRPDDQLNRIFEGTFQGHDFREGYAAFIAKRCPRFE